MAQARWEGSAGSIEGGALDRGSAAGASSAPAAPAALSKNWVWPGHGGKHPSPLKRGKPVLKVFVLWPKKAASPAKQFGQRKKTLLATSRRAGRKSESNGHFQYTRD
jgi:hypothetical protein